MKKFLAIIMAGAIVLSMAGCSGGNSSANSADSDSQQTSAADSSASAAQTAESSQPVLQESSEAGGSSAAPTAEADDDRTDYEKMVDRSLLSVGDMTRMADVFQKAQNGEDITVAYIGGSITEGYNAGTTEFYAKTCTDLLQGYFPDITVTGVNAGISGTPSLLGNLRLERDVLSADPDIVFVEFAVNDGQEADYKNAYESLVRTLLTQEKDIAVVLLFTVLDSGYTCQEHMSKIGANSDLPMISVHDSVYEEIEAGRMTWQDYSNDQSHPNAYGHKCITNFVDNYYQKVLPVVAENVGEVSKELPDPVFSAKYMNMHYMDSATMDGVELDGFEQYDTHGSFHNGWMYRGTDGGSMKFTVDCSVLEMVFKANNSDKYGTADIYVDGEKIKSVVSNMSDGWNNPVTAYLIDNDSSAEHTVEIRMEGGVTQAFFVMAFGYCD